MSNNSSLSTESPTTGDRDEVYLKLPIGFTIFELILQITIGLLGITGNVIVCATIIRRPKVLSAMSQYLLSLAFADLGVLLFILPLSVLNIQFSFEWVLGETLCLYIIPCTEMFYSAAIWSITTIAVERYANIAWKKMRIGGRRSLKRSRLIIIAIWVMSFAMASIPVYIYKKYDSDSRRCWVSFSTSFRSGYLTIKAILQYFLPLSIIAFCYQRIGKRVSERSRLFQDETTSQSEVRESSSMVNANAILQQTKRTQRILKPLVILFALTMLPLNIFDLVTAYWDGFFYQSYVKLLMSAVAISIFTNSAADPLVYCIVSKEFRTEVKSLLPGCVRNRLKRRRELNSTLKTKRSIRTTESAILAQCESTL